MKNVIILLSVFLFLFVAGVGFAGDSKKPSANGDVIFNFDNKGKVVSVEIGEKNRCHKKEVSGRDEAIEELKKLLIEGYTIVNGFDDVVILSKNPTCYIYLGGVPICICCN